MNQQKHGNLHPEVKSSLLYNPSYSRAKASGVMALECDITGTNSLVMLGLRLTCLAVFCFLIRLGS